MNDAETKQRLEVSQEGNGGPYLMVPSTQLHEVEHLLDEHHVFYWTDSDAISLNGKPAIAVINFGRDDVSSQVQQILDQAS